MRVWLSVMFASLIACTARYPAGVIVCSDSSDCPSGMSCHVEEDGAEGRCFPGANSGDSGLSMDMKTPDASADAAARDASTDAAQDASQAGAGAGGSTQKAGTGGSAGQARAGAGGRSGTAGTAGKGGSAGSSGKGGSAGSSGKGGAAGTGPAAGSGGAAGQSTPCDDPARVCDPGDVDMADGDCGQCGTGTRTRMRSCNASTCSWGAWSAWSACADPAKCAPSTMESRMVNCSGCGNKRQTRTCSETTCMFGAWTDAGSCSWCDACGQVVYCDTPDNIVPNRGTWCRPQNGCNNDQAWGRCLEILKENGCTVHEPRYIGQ